VDYDKQILANNVYSKFTKFRGYQNKPTLYGLDNNTLTDKCVKKLN